MFQHADGPHGACTPPALDPRLYLVLMYKKPIKESVGTAVKEQKVVDKKVKNYRQVVEVPELPESLPDFTVKAKLIVEFEDGTQEVAYDKTIPINLGESE